MGGYGSGRKARRGVLEQCLELRISYLHREGLLQQGSRFRLVWCGPYCNLDRAECTRTPGGLLVRHNFEQHILLDHTPCHFGGERPWFLCPACGRRVAMLYAWPRFGRFACRKCHDLRYAVQSEKLFDRRIRKARKLRARLGASRNLFQPIMEKPKWMRWRTFDELSTRATALGLIALRDAVAELEEQVDAKR